MISATRRWLRRNRNGLAIAAGVVGATYLVGQYVVSKISEARERSNLDRIAKEKYSSLLSWLICPPFCTST
jgi:peroxin-3